MITELFGSWVRLLYGATAEGDRMRRGERISLHMVILVILAAGCGPAPDGVPTQESPRSTPPARVATLPSAQDASEGKLGEAVIVFSRSGGIAGISNRWTIYANGRITDEAGQEYLVPSSEVDELLAAINDSGFFEAEMPPRKLGFCADCFTYALIVESEGRTAQIRFTDADTDIPQEIRELFGRIQVFLDSLVTP